MYIQINKKFLLMMAISMISNIANSAIQNSENNHKPGQYIQRNTTTESYHQRSQQFEEIPDQKQCPSNVECSELMYFPCIRCNYNMSCLYGEEVIANCTVKNNIECKGSRTLAQKHICRYCFLTEKWEHTCTPRSNCNSVAVNRSMPTTCKVNPKVFCLGKREFPKMVDCNWTRGFRWSTALIISITLGGFGVDRFYLGHWQEGIGKLFSFGGLGIWTLIDVILISIQYLGPSDGSIYI